MKKKFLHQLSIEKFQSIEPKIDKRVFDILSPEKSISQKIRMEEHQLLRSKKQY